MFYFHLTRKQRRDELLQEQQRQSGQLHKKTGPFHSERMERCKNCCKSVTTFIFSRVGLCLLVVAYAFAGGVVFQLLEGPHEGEVSQGVHRRLNITVERLFNTSEQSKVLHVNNWTTMARQILEEYQLDLVRQTKRGYQGERFEDDTKQWNFPGAILYAITVITTIGYGHITCKTNYGKIMTMIYAIFGIPLMLLCLANIGSTMADAFRFIYCNVCCSYCNMIKKRRNIRALQSVELSQNSSSSVPKFPNVTTSPPSSLATVSTNHIESKPSTSVVEFVDNFNIDYRKATIPISVTLSLLSSYLILGAVLFSEWENWKLLDGAYFCFVTLATIGLGDLVPGKSITSTQVEGKLVICALYVLFGLSLMAMCFNLMQEEVRAKFRRLGNKLGIIDDPNFW
ncbi:unnamed protein product [Rotaria socialis]|uniref:Potassium channel domain-containing protein n=1 Tax=Rotaria socialis TaxID=392032 RepID=A0A817Y5V7_9BILA|nr:unnamed protein product [Rotaria socialis]CAF3364434.1 unnamed protein product [Rotaria socialis]CAF3374569.1 unnamed protein product [Rotaria socialis]CAF3616723.1 unnamed protein product [Rotaria socialis]CAF3659204.1 unnamed protein product [Rotaria socialis]